MEERNQLWLVTPYYFALKVQSCKLYKLLTQIIDTESSAIIASLIFNLLSFVYKQAKQ